MAEDTVYTNDEFESILFTSFPRCSQPPSRGRPMRRIIAQGEALLLSPPSGMRAESLEVLSLRQVE